MPSLLSRLIGAVAPARETKYSRAAKLLAMHALGQPHWSARNSTALTREGYERNAVCHRCVRMVAEAAASVPWLVYEGSDEAIDHPLISLIERPNPLDTSASFIETICDWYIALEAFVTVREGRRERNPWAPLTKFATSRPEYQRARAMQAAGVSSAVRDQHSLQARVLPS